MPDYAPMIAYAGKGASGRPTFWSARGIDAVGGNRSDAARTELYREARVAALASALDAGAGGTTIQSMVRRLHRTPKALTLLAYRVRDAMRRYSERSVAESAATQRWILRHIRPGMTRARVARALESRGIHSRTFAPTAFCRSTATNFVARWWSWGPIRMTRAPPQQRRRPPPSSSVSSASPSRAVVLRPISTCSSTVTTECKGSRGLHGVGDVLARGAYLGHEIAPIVVHPHVHGFSTTRRR